MRFAINKQCPTCHKPRTHEEIETLQAIRQKAYDDYMSSDLTRRKSPGRPPKINIELAKNMRDEGQTYSQIAHYFDMHSAVVGRTLRKYYPKQKEWYEQT